MQDEEIDLNVVYINKPCNLYSIQLSILIEAEDEQIDLNKIKEQYES